MVRRERQLRALSHHSSDRTERLFSRQKLTGRTQPEKKPRQKTQLPDANTLLMDFAVDINPASVEPFEVTGLVVALAFAGHPASGDKFHDSCIAIGRS